MHIAILIPFIAVFIAGCVLGAFLVLLAGVRTEDRQMSLLGAAGTRSTAGTRRFLGVYHRGYDNPSTPTTDDLRS